jgi:1,2-dihydroxy-3-keto-5-methylthiopentene dioxygenase
MAKVTDVETGVSWEGAAASEKLRALGLFHEVWPLQEPTPRYCDDPAEAEAERQACLAQYADALDRLSAARGYRTRDVIQLWPATPGLEAMLANFQREHHHTEDEVRFIVDGEGVFTVFREGRRYDIVVAAGDVLAVPAGTRHWFTLTDRRTVTAVRLFTDPSGWVAIYDPPQEVAP